MITDVINLTGWFGIQEPVADVIRYEVSAPPWPDENAEKRSVPVTPESPVSLIASGLVDFGKPPVEPRYPRTRRRSLRSLFRRGQ